MTDCEIIKDFLPLYIEDMVSEKSKRFVEEHLKECAHCRQLSEKMSHSDFRTVHRIEPLEEFKKNLKKHIIMLVALSVFITVSVVCLIWEKFFMDPADVMGWDILMFWLILPVASFIGSLKWGKSESKTKYFAPVFFGIMGELVHFVAHGNYAVIIFAVPLMITSAIGLIPGCRKRGR